MQFISFNICFPKSFFILICIVVFSGCAQNPDLKGFDVETWRRDTRSCQNLRAGLLENFRKVSQNLTGLSHRDIIKILGRPEGESLENSGMRTYYYFTKPGPHCQKKPSTASKVAIRFDVLDRVNEVIFLN